MTAKKFKVIDEIIPESVGGAHRDWNVTADNLGKSLKKALVKFKKKSPQVLVKERINKFAQMGEVKKK